MHGYCRSPQEGRPVGFESMAIRRTKIVATIGPASESPGVLRSMIDAGMDMARISLSHGPLEQALDRMVRIRQIAAEANRPVGVMADLPGPKVRAADFGSEGCLLQAGSTIEVVEAGPNATTSDDRRIAIDYAGAVGALEVGDGIVLGDGAIQLIITSTDGERAVAEINTGGLAQGRPGVSLPSGRLDLSAPTEEDLRLLDGLYHAGVDAVAISFVNRASDIVKARDALGVDPPMLVAKIETQEAVDDVDAIVAVADAVMVARGDLGIRCALEDLPHYQKKVIHTGVAYGRPVITATQMLESMVRAPVPTRAEVTDVANAVFDGTSAVMLSGETAVGAHPVEAVVTMGRIAERAEQDFPFYEWGHELGREQTAEAQGASATVRVTAAISAAASRAVVDADVSAVIACTVSGDTARSISRYRPSAPIVATTPSERTLRQLTMSWGVIPILVAHRATTDDIVWFAVEAAAERKIVQQGDVVAVLVGSPSHPDPTTDTLRLVRVS